MRLANWHLPWQRLAAGESTVYAVAGRRPAPLAVHRGTEVHFETSNKRSAQIFRTSRVSHAFKSGTQPAPYHVRSLVGRESPAANKPSALFEFAAAQKLYQRHCGETQTKWLLAGRASSFWNKASQSAPYAAPTSRAPLPSSIPTHRNPLLQNPFLNTGAW